MKDKNRTIIEADAIRLRDKNGKTRILLDAGVPDGVASISLFSADENQSVSIMSQPDNRVEISLRGVGGLSYLTLSMGDNNAPSITLSDLDGRLGLVLGVSQFSKDSCNQILLFRNGQISSSIPSEISTPPKSTASDQD